MSSVADKNDQDFGQWQNGIQQKYRDFLVSIDSLRDKPTRLSYFDISGNKDRELNDQITDKDEISILLQQIKYLEMDIEKVIQLMSIQKIQENPRAQKLLKKLEQVGQSVRSMKDRALTIQNQY